MTDLPDRDEAWLAGAAVDKIVTAYEEGVLRSRDEMDKEAMAGVLADLSTRGGDWSWSEAAEELADAAWGVTDE